MKSHIESVYRGKLENFEKFTENEKQQIIVVQIYDFCDFSPLINRESTKSQKKTCPLYSNILLVCYLLDILSPVTLLVFLIKDYGLSLRKGLNTDFYPGLILLSVGILSRMHFRRIVNVGPKRKASECMPLTTGKMNFYALLT